VGLTVGPKAMEERKIFPLPDIEPPALQPVARRYTDSDVPTSFVLRVNYLNVCPVTLQSR
jgi:hypothetical protein